MFAFRLYILAVACVAAGSFQLTAELCERAVGQSKKRDGDNNNNSNSNSGSYSVSYNGYDEDSSSSSSSGASFRNIIVNYDDSSDRSSRLPLRVFWQQVWHQNNVWTFGLINFIQVRIFCCFLLLLT